MPKYTQRMQKDDGTPNWDLVPDATHYIAESDTNYESFLKKQDGKWWFTGPDENYGWQPDMWMEDEDVENGFFIAKA